MNVYHTPQYQDYRQRCGFVFSEAHRSSLPGKTQSLAEGYSVRTDYYTGQLDYQICAARHSLLDGAGRAVHTWDNLDFDGEFCSLISHANGNHYLVFREDLYGYSVLEVETGRTMHYIPEKSWPLDGGIGQETFIWTNAAYDSSTSLLAVCRRLPTYLDSQRAHVWKDEGPMKTILGGTVLVLGAGHVGADFAQALAQPGREDHRPEADGERPRPGL